MLRNVGFIAAVSALLAATTAGAAAVIDGGDIRNSSVTGKDVRNKSLTKRDFRGSVRGPRGFAGPQGPAGPAGPQGPAGPTSTSGITVARTTERAVSGPFIFAVALCPSGQRAISGGGVADADDGLLGSDTNDARDGWVTAADAATAIEIEATALCAGSDRAVVARVGSRSRRLERLLRHAKRLAAEIEAAR